MVVVTLERVPRRLIGVGAAHRETWRIIWDRVFADAALAGVETLHVVMPTSLPEDELHTRSGLARDVSGTGTAEAWLGVRPERIRPVDKIYLVLPFWRWVLNRGGVRTLSAGFTKDEVLFLYPWRAWVLGLSMRVLNRLHQPYLADRALFAVRSRLATRRTTWCGLVFTVWARKPGPSPTGPAVHGPLMGATADGGWSRSHGPAGAEDSRSRPEAPVPGPRGGRCPSPPHPV